MTILMETHVAPAASDDYLERVESAASATEALAAAESPSAVALVTYGLAFVLVGASAALGSGPLFLAVAAGTVIAAAEIFYGNGVTTPEAS